jgi:CheY-like chemotaxis protein
MTNLRGGHVILVVDDDDDTRFLVRAALEDLGLRTLGAGDEAEAVQVLQAERGVDVMITDVFLRTGDGVRLSRLARAMRPVLGCVFATGDIARATLLVASGEIVLRKPYRVVDMQNALETVLADRAPAASRDVIARDVTVAPIAASSDVAFQWT